MEKILSSFSNLNVEKSFKNAFFLIPMEFWYILIVFSALWLIYLLTGIGSRKNGVAVIINRYKSVFYVITAVVLIYVVVYLFQIRRSIRERKLEIDYYQLYSLISIAISIVASIIIYSLIRKIKNCPTDKKKKVSNALLSITIVFALIVFTALLLSAEIMNFANKVDGKLVFGKESAMMFAYAFAVLSIGLAVYSAKNDNYQTNNLKSYIEGAVTIIFAVILSKLPFSSVLKLSNMVYLAIVPIVIFSFRYGTYKGMLVALYSGAIVGILDYNIVSPMQYFALYPASFVTFSFVSTFTKQSVKRPISAIFWSLCLIQILRLALYITVIYFYSPVVSNPFGIPNIAYIALTGAMRVAFEWIYSFLVLMMILVQGSTREKMLVDRYNNLIRTLEK